MSRALIIGGTRFIGRHLVTELLDAGYEVTLFNRGNHDNPFAENDDVAQFTGDRTSDAALEQARDEVDPSIVVDCVAYYPGEVRMATEIFADVDAYVFVSSGSAYGTNEIPKREGQTALEPCSDEQAVDDSHESYGARKAEGDRAVFEAAEDGVRAMSVRPTIVYGPHDYTGRLNYWTERVRSQDRVLVPGDGTNIHHLVAVENVVRAIRTVAEEGTPGEAYNVGDHRVLTLGEVVEQIATGLDADVEIVTAVERDLADGGLEAGDFPLYNPNPHLLSTAKLYDLGWAPVDPTDAIADTVTTAYDTERDPGPDPADTEGVLRSLDS
ncbi:NAD-dependent epimerase/dehydratase family protein [Salinarchaeum laminariae]|uniref:NAD-dependent epimerase/dehydratase family protein n=1 Tax=Salinarchaeum laminariae TaxID=869888 RepID=UPI0020C188B0|nr:NAD-dependent epimerase/dehydratase family protein [Salinarchaeum laminariae]